MDLRPASPETIARALGECTVIAGGYKCKCPSHEDAKASLQINIVGSKDGKTTVHCHAGCKPGDVFKAIEDKTGMYFESRIKAAAKDDKSDAIFPAPIDWPPELAYNGIPHSAAYPYYDAENNLMFVVARWNLPGGSKRILPYSVVKLNGQPRWMAQLKLRTKPIYNLVEVLQRPDAPILIVEGEKAANVGKYDPRFENYVVVTYQGGAINWKHSDWGPIKGKEVYLIPDNDDAGKDSFVELAQHLNLNQFCSTVRIADIPRAFPPKWDIADEWPEGVEFTDFKWYNAPEPSINTIKDSITPANYLEAFTSLYWLLYDGNVQSTIEKQRWIHSYGNPFAPQLHRVNNIHPMIRSCFIGRDPAISIWANTITNEGLHVSGFRFRPGSKEPLLEEHGERYINTFTGFASKPSQGGECKLIMAFLRDIVCDGDEKAHIYLLNYLSHMLQFPHHRPTVAIILKGVQGSGKSTLGRIIGKMLGASEKSTGYFGSFGTLDKVLGKFNHVLAGKIAIFVEELEITKSRTMENALKSLITDPTIMIEPKGKEQYQENNYARIFGASNHNHIWNVTADERRLTVLELSDSQASKTSYFNPLNKEINDLQSWRAFVDYLMAYEVDHDLVRLPLQNKARASQALATKSPNKEVALRMLLAGEVNMRIYDERKEIIAAYHVSREDWVNAPIKIPSHLSKRIIQNEVDTGRYGEAFFSARDKRVRVTEFVKMLGWTEPTDGSSGYTTISTITHGAKTKDAGYPIGNLQQARVAFCKYHDVSYESVFDVEDEKIISLPDAVQLKKGEIPF